MKQGDIVELEIESLSNNGNGVGRHENQVVFVPDAVTGDRLKVRLVRVKRKYSTGKIVEIIAPSPRRIRPRCIVADKCGGCQWQHIDYQYQLEAKRHQVRETLQRIGGFAEPPVLAPLGAADLGYRNKVSYPLGRAEAGNLQAGYYRKGTHKIVNLNQCPIQDPRLNPLLRDIKRDLEKLPLPIYDEKTHQGALRHLCFRIGQNTGEILVTIVSKAKRLLEIAENAPQWLEKYPNVVGVLLNHNPHPTNVIFGSDTYLMAGRLYLQEIFAGLTLHLHSDTFFQVNTAAAEMLLTSIVGQLQLTGAERILDLYCGVGTFTLPLGRKATEAIGIESQLDAVKLAQNNAKINGIENAKFLHGRAEAILPQLEFTPDLVWLDPPRQGCKPEVIESLLRLKPARLVYVSCHSATLARDLKLLSETGAYQLKTVQPVDFFPQTSHVECAAILERK